MGLEERKTGTNHELVFDKPGKKTLYLYVYSTQYEGDVLQKELYSTHTWNVFIYKHAVPYIHVSDTHSNIIDDAQTSGVLLYDVAPGVTTTTLVTANVSQKLDDFYENMSGELADFLLIIGSRNDAFSVLSKMNQELQDADEGVSHSIVLYSHDNISIFPQLFKNFLTGKNWLDTFLITNQLSRVPMLEH